jgi:hypothetical protein
MVSEVWGISLTAGQLIDSQGLGSMLLQLAEACTLPRYNKQF